ncbi:hypothetical protein F8M41_013631 [Gigaspora margarita]|uniref:Uncharacterized protein n=1 Tax=Gigaspora margarita TaxID=4874 RepID=A0A8H3WZI8_GIGMA|nr:hypothetical protein F8M41_013631 [Gigaspora margarita]
MKSYKNNKIAKDNKIANAQNNFNISKSQYLIAMNNFNKAKIQYFAELDYLFNIASTSEDYSKAFEVLQRIQNKGDDWTKGQTKNKLKKRLLCGFGCQQNINEARKLIEEAAKLGHSHARIWSNQYHLIDDFGASEVIKNKMV